MTVELIGGELKVTNGPEYFVIEDKKRLMFSRLSTELKVQGLNLAGQSLKIVTVLCCQKTFYP